MDNITSKAVLNYQEDTYLNSLTNSSSQLNVSTLQPARPPLLTDIEYKEFIRRLPEFSFMICLSLIGTIGNAHTILVYTRLRHMIERSKVRTLIIWLSAVDLTTSVVVMPFEMVVTRLGYSISSNAICKLVRYISHSTAFSSWLILTVIAYERYKSIYNILLGTSSSPKSLFKVTRWIKTKSTYFKHNFVCILIIILSLMISTPFAVVIGIETVQLKEPGLFGTICTTQYKYRTKLYTGFFVGIITSFVMLCFICCSYCYGKIICIIRKQSVKAKRRRENNLRLRGNPRKAKLGSGNCKPNMRNAKYKVTISLIVATALSFCSSMIFAITISEVLLKSELKRNRIVDFALRGIFINHTCNPVIYFLFDTKFRNACKKLYTKQK
ncbi:unnamed protein product [Mytilus coruscus]|uniref:G-protein coupled receptors family 1 profile domain-containing protein n=1 Tax=Mytilus coruscus TaxID=42192 RepID=A0A6J8DUE0_MYTCO|nr:unnamed protein product [Mytilus coruscus]